MSLRTIPSDVVSSKILPYLSDKELARFSAVSRTAYDQARSDSTYMQKLGQSKIQRPSLKDVYDKIGLKTVILIIEPMLGTEFIIGERPVYSENTFKIRKNTPVRDIEAKLIEVFDSNIIPSRISLLPEANKRSFRWHSLRSAQWIKEHTGILSFGTSSAAVRIIVSNDRDMEII